MKFYSFHISDFNQATRHLSRAERSIYRDLLDLYYDRESPLPDDIPEISKIILAIGDEITVESILKEFFYLEENNWHNSRANTELNRVYDKSVKAKASANTRWEKQRKHANAMRTQCDEDANAMLPITHNPRPITLDPLKEAPPAAESDFSSRISRCPQKEILNLYHTILPMCPPVVKMTPARQDSLRARWRGDAEGNIKFFEDYFSFVAKSKFLTGKVNPGNGRTKPFVADIDFLIKPSTVVKVQEGKYHG